MILHRIGDALLRHATWAVFALIAIALLPSPAMAQRRPGPGPVLTASATESTWVTAQSLAGLAALVAATADGAVKVINALRRDVSLEACPFSVAGVALCHGKNVPPTAENDRKAGTQS